MNTRLPTKRLDDLPPIIAEFVAATDGKPYVELEWFHSYGKDVDNGLDVGVEGNTITTGVPADVRAAIRRAAQANGGGYIHLKIRAPENG